MYRIVFITLSLLCTGLFAGARTPHEIVDPRILSFEDATHPVEASEGSRIAVSDRHFRHLAHSLRWNWDTPGASIRIARPIGYLDRNPDPDDTGVSTFVCWVYAPRATDGKLTFEFLRAGEVCCRFEWGLAFSGWRGAWVAFDRDMEGRPCEGMDELVITAPDTPSGELYFDHIILSSFQDVRYHTADSQLPFINSGTDSHWLRLLAWRRDTLSGSVPRGTEGMGVIAERLDRMMLENAKPKSESSLRERFDGYSIRVREDGSTTGKSIFFIRYGETYISLGYRDAAARYKQDGMLLQPFNDLMFDLASSYRLSRDDDARERLAAMYLTMIRHLLDQGYRDGSALGTLHHLGYSMRNFYTSAYLMRDALAQAGLAEEVQAAMEWFSGLGEVKTLPQAPGMDIDAFNTSLTGRLAALLMLPDGAYKTRYLWNFARWVDNGLALAEGTSPCLKSDGTVFHHRRHYPAYAIGGFTGAVNAVWLLSGTDFQITPQSHQNLKHALIEMRFYCNLRSFPLALSGRHPDGRGALIPAHYARLAQAGSPDASLKTDPELAAAYMRLVGKPDDPHYRSFAAQGIVPEPSPEGFRVYPYNSSVAMRRGDWLLTAAGHSRYLWSAEIYRGANHYGRYLTHGSLQLLGGGDPVSAFGSGFRQEGWDWRHIPGTTAAAIPMERMKADIRNVDTFSGYEEMLLSDESFAGGVSHRGMNGMYAMILHENDKYNGSLRARKSFFMFDNCVVALGTGIENGVAGSGTHTTLFQNALIDGHRDFAVDGDRFTGIGHSATLPKGGVLRDNFGTLYVTSDRVVARSAIQRSLHEETDEPTQGEFVTAYIDHGEVVKGGSYRYLMIVQPDERQLRTSVRKLPYRVLRQDERAHIVEYGGIVGMAVFEAGAVGDGFVREASLPSLLMYSRDGDGSLTISVCDPDLRFYPGDADEIRDENGKTIERSVYSRTWIDNPSEPSTLSVRVRGQWAVEGDACTARIDGSDTLLEFRCREGATREARLVPAGRAQKK